jgi:hypothetical protein
MNACPDTGVQEGRAWYRVVTLVRLTGTFGARYAQFFEEKPAMRIGYFSLALVVLAGSLMAQEQPAASQDATPPSQPTPAKDAPAASAQPAVDAASVKGTTFESQYFKFTYELPAGWKALDDSARMKSNREVLEQDEESAKQMSDAPPKRGSSKATSKPTKSAKVPGVSPVIERYNLMAASPNGITSLAAEVLPRVNIWAHRRVPPFDTPLDNVRLAIQGKRSSVLVAPQEITYNGQTYARVQLITPSGQYQSRYIITIGDYLVGFDFWTQSERELVELSDTIKSVRFQ